MEREATTSKNSKFLSQRCMYGRLGVLGCAGVSGSFRAQYSPIRQNTGKTAKNTRKIHQKAAKISANNLQTPINTGFVRQIVPNCAKPPQKAVFGFVFSKLANTSKHPQQNRFAIAQPSTHPLGVGSSRTGRQKRFSKEGRGGGERTCAWWLVGASESQTMV